MNVLPIIIRELRAESRHPANYALRAFGATVLTAFLAFFLWGQDSAQSGGSAFRALNFIIFCTIWIAVPLLTADSLSREKREGTLGLLFLTPLKPIEIILGKGTIHAIRSLTLLIAGIPILAIPFVLGGITGANVFWSLLLNVTATMLALAAGLLASAFCRQWSRAIILAEIFSAIFLFAAFKIAVMTLFGLWGWRDNAFIVLRSIYESFLYAPRLHSMQMKSGILTTQTAVLIFTLFATVVLFLALVILFAARRLKNTWQENPMSARQLWVQKTFCTPRFWTGFLVRRNQSRLSSNPVGWLQQYSWNARVSKWGWCAVVITIISWLLTGNFGSVYFGCAWLKHALLASMAFSAVGSFQREKQNGALELLLVTPLRENQIIYGRLLGIWGQFLPAFVILLLTIKAVPAYYSYGGKINIFNSIGAFVVVPVVGLYFAMRLKNLMIAWLATCSLALFLPPFAGSLYVKWMYGTGMVSNSRKISEVNGNAQITVLFLLAAIAGILLHAQLKNRSFALVRT